MGHRALHLAGQARTAGKNKCQKAGNNGTLEGHRVNVPMLSKATRICLRKLKGGHRYSAKSSSGLTKINPPGEQ